jgi:hypothetical protein
VYPAALRILASDRFDEITQPWKMSTLICFHLLAMERADG